MLVELVFKIDHHRNLFIGCLDHLLLVLVERPVAGKALDQCRQLFKQDFVGTKRLADNAAQMGLSLTIVVQNSTLKSARARTARTRHSRQKYLKI